MSDVVEPRDTNRPNLSPMPMDSLSTGPSLSPEMERDYYKEKVEHFKVLIRKLQDEVQSYKLRKEGTATVTKLLQESKQEVCSLTKKIRAYESVFRILRSRLEKNGLSSEITLQDDEQYLPGHSKILVDNLTRENKRLRNVLKNNTGDPEAYARLQQLLQESSTANGNLQTRVVELEEVLRASDNEKDRTITKLREELSHLNREINARDIRCSTLSNEAEQLQKQLEDVAHQCHELAKKLHQQMNTQSTPAKTVETHRKEESPMDVNENSPAWTEEKKALQERVQEITEMNKRWQDYNKQRETFVGQLTHELNEMKAQQTSRTSHGDASREFQAQINQVLDDARRNIDAANRQKSQVQVQLDNANRNISLLTEEIRQLKERRSSETSPDTAETIQALKAQIQICTEDFESERKDREKAQTKISRQESEINRLRKEVDELRRHRELRQSSSPQPQPVPVTQYTDPFYHYEATGSAGNIGTERLAARGVGRPRGMEHCNVIDGSARPQMAGAEKSDAMKEVTKDTQIASDELLGRSGKNKLSDEEYHSLRTSSLSSNSNRASPTPSPRRSENSSPTQYNIPPETATQSGGACASHPRDIGNQRTYDINDCLQCPKCEKEYSHEEHSELIEHIEMCCD